MKIGSIDIIKAYFGTKLLTPSNAYIGSTPIIAGEIDYLEFTSTGNSGISLTNYGTNAPNIEYSLNGGTWTTWDYSNIAMSDGDVVRMRGNNISGLSTGNTNYSNFAMSGSVDASGNIMSLINKHTATTTVPCVYCFYKLFLGCTALTSAPELPATTLTTACYASMFYGCSGLTTAPELPATNLGQNCYQSLFQNCTALDEAPELPATTLQNHCYKHMFRGCSSIEVSPELNAETLVEGCYGYMFEGCSNLNYITCYATDISASNSTTNWVLNVSASGTFMRAASMTDWTTGVNGIPTNWEVVIPSIENYLTFTSTGNSGISMNNYGTNAPDIDYSLNGSDWTTWDYSNISLSDGDVLRMRGLNENGIGSSSSKYSMFVMTGSIAASGSVMSLIDDIGSSVTIPNGSYCFNKLFNNCKIMTTAPALTATTLSEYCYNRMFFGCIGLTTAPALPANTLSTYCYNSMFQSCTGLTTAPTVLPATTLADYCYYRMFYGCTGLTNAPTLPATTLASYCYYQMFWLCTALTTAPALPATTLATYCYREIFNGCTGLTTAPTLPATTLATYCYYGMFKGCTGLTTAPALPATTLETYCYSQMLYGCTGLTTAPTLPATTLATYCYYQMFYGCTGLTTAPELPATTLTTACYYQMFSNCTNINSITCYATDISASNSTSNWVGGVSASGTFVRNDNMYVWSIGTSGIPSNWEVSPPLPEATYLTFISTGNSGISMTNYGNNSPNIEYSLNDGTWTTWDYSNISLSNGDVVRMRGTNTNGFSYSEEKYSKFAMTGSIAAFGNIMTLIDTSGNTLVIPNTWCFTGLFDGCSALTTAPTLPATTLQMRCYNCMFQNCTSLITPPELPATSTVHTCYLAMFSGCTSMTTTPELPALSVAEGAYQYMFRNCSNIHRIKVYATTFYDRIWITYYWVQGVPSYGTFLCPTASSDYWTSVGTSNYAGIPSGWTKQTF